MTLQTKALEVKEIDEAGKGLARIALLSSVDHDGDTYAPGAFAWKEQWAPILPAHDRRATPLGKARLYETGDEALAELHLNLKTAAGREWHETLKFDLENGTPVQEWSYGYDILEKSDEVRAGVAVRMLKKLDVHEISTVVRGAGKGTGTLAMKSHGGFGPQIDAIIEEIDDVVERAGGIKALRAAEGRPMSAGRIAQLSELKGRLDQLLAEGEVDPEKAARLAEAEHLASQYFTFDARRRHRS